MSTRDTDLSAKKASLLIVHDEQTRVIAFCLALEREGYAVTCSTSADSALALLGEQTFDLVRF